MELTDIWLAALKSKHGVAIETDNPNYLRTLLYTTRKNMNKAALNALMVGIPKGKSEVWIAWPKKGLDD